jgi:hypothetical protein
MLAVEENPFTGAAIWLFRKGDGIFRLGIMNEAGTDAIK